MSIIRVEKNGDYTILANAPLNDERLSWEARGLLAYLLSKPNNWKVNSRALVKKAPAGRAKVQRILRELEEHGYLERRKVRGEHGRFEWESVVREIPVPPAQDNIDDQPAEQLEVEAEAQQPQAETDSTMAQKPSHGEAEEVSTMAQFSADGETADGKTADGKPSQLINTVLTKTDLTNTDQAKPRKRKVTTAASNTRTRGKHPQTRAAAVAAASNLPNEIRDALKALGWTGSMGEVAAAWQQDPARARAWVEYAQRKRWSAALLRAMLREDPGYPPREPDPAERYLGDYPPPDDAPETRADAPSSPAPPPDLPAPVRQWWRVVQEQLRMEMPKAAFDTWVRPAFPLAFADANGGERNAVLTVAAVNDYAQRWLTERLTKILERKLAGLAGHPVTVQFVVLEDVHA